MRVNNGITLVELMVTVAVIGILAVVSVPAYQEYIRVSDTGKCAKYILNSRLNATSLITMENADITAIDATDLGLDNNNDECSGGIAVSEDSGNLNIQGNTGTLGSAVYSRRFIMTYSSANGSWSCQTTDSSGNDIDTSNGGSCVDID